MKTSDFDYNLDESLIANEPLPQRSASRLLCLNKTTGEIAHNHFTNLPDLLNPGDLLIFNDTKVVPARMTGTKHTGGYVNILIERVIDDFTCPEFQRILERKGQRARTGSVNVCSDTCEPEAQRDDLRSPKAEENRGKYALAHMKGANTPLPGTHVKLANDVNFTIEGRDIPFFIIKLYDTNKNWYDVMNEVGEMPLPPYIERKPEDTDHDRYQTVYADSAKAASVAAPTAGLHFDEQTLTALKTKGINTAHVTLHVGAGTFQPLRTEGDEDPRNHQMHSERIEITKATINQINETRKNGGRIIAVGTTAVRCLETAQGKPYSGETDIFITPGYDFKYIDALITNFHLPKTTLMMLVSAFAGHDHTMNAYAQATQEKYRFFSYGDAMYIS